MKCKLKDSDDVSFNIRNSMTLVVDGCQYNKNNGKGIMLYGHVHDSFIEKNIMDNISKDIKLFSTGMNYNCNYINCYCKLFDYKPQTLNELTNVNK